MHTGAAIFTPSIDLDGTIEVKVRVDKRILEALRMESTFNGKLQNPENVGKSMAELIDLWNQDHPEDPITA